MKLLYDPAIVLLGIYPRKIKTFFSCKKKKTQNIHNSFISKSQSLEPTHIFSNKWMFKQSGGHTYYEMLLIDKKE